MQASLDVQALRQQFPALQKRIDGNPVIFLDGPGGTQVPQSVIDAMSNYLMRDNANLGGLFLNSQRTELLLAEARRAMADFLNARRPEEIVFGQNMTSLTYAMSRAIARTWSAGDEIVLSQIDHNANIDPWLQAAADKGVTVRWIPVDPETCTLRLDKLPSLLNARTKLVAVTFASNAVGSVTDIELATKMAHTVGALIYVDAVHYAPHGNIDVQALNVDFLASSPYKYYGPHLGAVYGKYRHLDELEAYRVRPAKSVPPGKWETGTQSFESINGARAAIDYIAELGEKLPPIPDEDPNLSARRRNITRAMHASAEYEREISKRFIEGSRDIPGMRIFGVTDLDRLDQRTSTFAVRKDGVTPQQLGQHLAQNGVYMTVGDFYALTLMETLDLLDSGGVVRIGFVHYNTLEEVDRVLDLIRTA